nr:AbrB/MazE/SpoVT family DNA-binding domain-containing protein [Candidatus Njordarchaeota archaeon]
MPELFKTKVRRVGTSLGVLIPKELARRHKIREGEEVQVGLLRESRLKLIEKAFGIAEGAEPFERDRTDRLERDQCH